MDNEQFKESKAMECASCGEMFWYDSEDKTPRWHDCCDLCNIDLTNGSQGKY